MMWDSIILFIILFLFLFSLITASSQSLVFTSRSLWMVLARVIAKTLGKFMFADTGFVFKPASL